MPGRSDAVTAIVEGRWARVGAVTLVIAALIVPLGGSAFAKKPCPVNSTTDYFVNPAGGDIKDKDKEKDKGEPTGVSSPAECSFSTITEALSAIEAGGTGGRVIITGAGSGTAVLSNETFPLLVPEGVTVTTSDDPALGGTGLDPTRYIVEFSDGATNAFSLQGGDVKGVTLKNAGSLTALAMALCESGSSALGSVTLDGASPAGGHIERGLDLSAGCRLTASQVRVRNSGGPGVVVGAGADLSLTDSKVHNNAGDGLVVRGDSDVLQSVIALNGDDGILVEQGTSSFRSLEVRDNAGNGFEVHSSDVTILSNMIFNNSRTHGWDKPQMLFVGGPPTDGVYVMTSSGCLLAYPVGSQVDECDPDTGEDTGQSSHCDGGLTNTIFGYNRHDAGVGTVGLRAESGAVVNATFNEWASSVPSDNVTSDAFSFVKGSPTCGVRGDPGDTSTIPV